MVKLTQKSPVRRLSFLTGFLFLLVIAGGDLFPRTFSDASVAARQVAAVPDSGKSFRAEITDDRSVLRDHEPHWTAGLKAYRAQDMKIAAAQFEALLTEDSLPACDRAAAAFWAYRALNAAGDAKNAVTYAKQAASEPASFYSILARHVIGDHSAHDDMASDSAYPLPNWKPTSGYTVEPALLFAIIRQESGFNPAAKSSVGARGVMQLMPATAHAMARAAHVIGREREPSVSMMLGQSYLQNLMDTSEIGDNLVFLTAAYNAGPGTVEGWQQSLHYNDDPLLFVESIPYGETREYVVRVIGNYWVYSQLLGGTDSASLVALTQGQWPHYGSSGKELTSMLSHLGANRIE